MPLPILHSKSEPTPADLIRLFHRTSAHWAEQVGEPEPLDVGAAYSNPQLPGVAAGNHLRDAALPGMSPREAVETVEAHFAGRQTRCHYWVMNPSAPPERTEPLIAYLRGLGYRAISSDILYLKRLPQGPVAEIGGFKIIPARSAYAQARALAEEQHRGLPDASQLAAAAQLRLDDPHYDALLALGQSGAVASVGVLSVGELGRVENLYVAEGFRGRGLGRTMMSRAMEICARSLFKHVYIEVPPEYSAVVGLFGKFGFEKIGQSVSFHASP